MFNVMRIDRKEERNIRTLKYDHLKFNIIYIMRTLNSDLLTIIAIETIHPNFHFTVKSHLTHNSAALICIRMYFSGTLYLNFLPILILDFAFAQIW